MPSHPSASEAAVAQAQRVALSGDGSLQHVSCCKLNVPIGQLTVPTCKGRSEGMGALHIVVVGGGCTRHVECAPPGSERGIAVTRDQGSSALASGSTGRSMGVIGTQHVITPSTSPCAPMAFGASVPGGKRSRVSPDRLSAAGEVRRRPASYSSGASRNIQRECGIDKRLHSRTGRYTRAGARHQHRRDNRRIVWAGTTGLPAPQLTTVLAGVREMGGIVRQRCGLIGVNRRGAGYRLKTSAETIDYDRVVIASGAWAGRGGFSASASQ